VFEETMGAKDSGVSFLARIASQLLVIDTRNGVALPTFCYVIADGSDAVDAVLAQSLVHSRPRLGESLAADTGEDDVVPTIPLGMVKDSGNVEAEGLSFVLGVKKFQGGVLPCRISSVVADETDLDKGVSSPPHSC
jgi:hypothetical protein